MQNFLDIFINNEPVREVRLIVLSARLSRPEGRARYRERVMFCPPDGQCRVHCPTMHRLFSSYAVG